MKMKQEAIRQALIGGTIHVIAQNGLDGATTKKISQETGINEAYIYRHFEDKEDMFVHAFTQLDQELADTLSEHIALMYVSDLKVEERCWILFSAVWRFLLGNSNKCTCYMQYYYSPYFRKYSAEEHRRIYKQIEEDITPAFQEDVNVWQMLNYILDVMLASAVKVFAGDMADNDKTAAQVFRLIYGAVESQLAWTQKLA